MMERQLELVEASGISVCGSTETACALHRKLYQGGGIGAEIAVLVDYGYGDVGQVFPIGFQRLGLGFKLKMVGTASGVHGLLRHDGTIHVVGHNAQFAGLILHVVPYQTIAAQEPKSVLPLSVLRLAEGQFALHTLTLAVDEEFGTLGIGVEEIIRRISINNN